VAQISTMNPTTMTVASYRWTQRHPHGGRHHQLPLGFGILSHPAINSEGHEWGNYGIMDQQAVLRWVQANIAKAAPNEARALAQPAPRLQTL